MATRKRRTSARQPAAPAARRNRSSRKREVAAAAGTTVTDTATSHARPARSALTIVAIGASAGGMEAISRLFRNITGTTNMAFVVVQHLAPRYESLLPELLGSSSKLPVVQVAEGMPLQANRVHVIPPDVEMSVIRRRLHLAPRSSEPGLHNPIDTFFRSLAQDPEVHAVGIVLSGSASDGSQGLAELKNAGAITIAQDPKSAKFGDMPRAAIATGLVDLILTPEQMADALMRLARHPFLIADEASDEEASDFSDAGFDALFKLLRGVSGVDFTHYKLPTIKRRLQRRMVLHRVSTLKDYLKVLRQDAQEIRNLYRDLLIHVTRFFRDPESFAVLTNVVFPRIVADAGSKRPVRIWVPGCASGEEPYSLAIALLEHLDDRADSVPIHVFATDVSEESLERARAGLYPESIAADVSAERLRRFFTHAQGGYRINKLVRDSCIFARQDLTRDPPFSKLDLILCRNVLIYLGPRLQRRLMAMFHYALKPSGFLMVGSSETIGPHGEHFAVIDKKHQLYTKRSSSGTQFEPRPHYEVPSERPSLLRQRPMHALTQTRDIQSEVTRLLVSRYSPPAVVVDHEFQIIQTRGKTGPYLELASGEPSLNLMKLAREGLLHGVRTALQEAQRTLRPTRRDGLIVRTNGSSRVVSVQVLPIGDVAETPYFLVLFEPAPEGRAEKAPAKGTKARGSSKAEKRLAETRQELASSRDYLQAIIHDLEAANEELQSANEEILTSNEELQSTNEELDTAKEELQSSNEELNTVNEELNARNEELSHVNSDLVNLLTAVPVAIVIVSADVRIRRYTPPAEQILNLIPTDIGRPLGDIKPNLDVPDLEELTRSVIESVTMKELMVRDRLSRQYSLRIRPYKNQENRIDGAVLSFTEQVGAQEGLLAERRFMEGVLRSAPCGLLVVDDDLRVRLANPAAATLLGESSSAAIEGKRLPEVAGQRLDASQLSAQLARLFGNNLPFEPIVLTMTGPTKRELRFDGRALEGTVTDRPLALLAVHESE